MSVHRQSKLGNSNYWLKLSDWLAGLLNILIYNFLRPLPLLGLCVKSSCPFFSVVFLFRVYLVPLAARYCLVLCYCLVYLAGCSSAASCPFIVVIYSYVSYVYIVLDF